MCVNETVDIHTVAEGTGESGSSSARPNTEASVFGTKTCTEFRLGLRPIR
jgi:hypothetical protein